MQKTLPSTTLPTIKGEKQMNINELLTNYDDDYYYQEGMPKYYYEGQQILSAYALEQDDDCKVTTTDEFYKIKEYWGTPHLFPVTTK